MQYHGTFSRHPAFFSKNLHKLTIRKRRILVPLSNSKYESFVFKCCRVHRLNNNVWHESIERYKNSVLADMISLNIEILKE
jgi:hypothetical protein